MAELASAAEVSQATLYRFLTICDAWQVTSTCQAGNSRVHGIAPAVARPFPWRAEALLVTVRLLSSGQQTGVHMGFISRRIVPRSVRRAVHPVRTAKRAVYRAAVPRNVRRTIGTAHKIANPISTAGHTVEKAVFGSGAPNRRITPAGAYGNCGVRHGSLRTAANCRNCTNTDLKVRDSADKSFERVGISAVMCLVASIGFFNGGGGAVFGLLLLLAVTVWWSVVAVFKDDEVPPAQ